MSKLQGFLSGILAVPLLFLFSLIRGLACLINFVGETMNEAADKAMRESLYWQKRLTKKDNKP